MLHTDYPDPFYASNASLARAEALVNLGHQDEAVAAFRAALEARRQLPNVINYAYVEFAWTVARWRAREYYDEVLEVLREFFSPSDVAFPVIAYRYFGALALIAADLGDVAEARKWAAEALRAASVRKGPFRRHPDFGTLNPADVNLESHRLLWQLGAA